MSYSLMKAQAASSIDFTQVMNGDGDFCPMVFGTFHLCEECRFLQPGTGFAHVAHLQGEQEPLDLDSEVTVTSRSFISSTGC